MADAERLTAWNAGRWLDGDLPLPGAVARCARTALLATLLAVTSGEDRQYKTDMLLRLDAGISESEAKENHVTETLIAGNTTEEQRRILKQAMTTLQGHLHIVRALSRLFEHSDDALLDKLRQRVSPNFPYSGITEGELLTTNGIATLDTEATSLRDSDERIIKSLTSDLDPAELPNNMTVRAYNWLRERAQAISDAEEVSESVSQAQAAAREAQTASQAASQASSDTAASALAGDFSTTASNERKRGRNFRVFAVVVIAMAVGYAAWITYSFVNDTDTAHIIQKLVVSIPALLLAAYFFREAAHHRARAEWAETLAVQLNTLPAYVSELDLDERTLVRMYLAARAFGATDLPDGEDEAGLNMLPTLIEQLTKLAQSLRGTRQ